MHHPEIRLALLLILVQSLPNRTPPPSPYTIHSLVSPYRLFELYKLLNDTLHQNVHTRNLVIKHVENPCEKTYILSKILFLSFLPLLSVFIYTSPARLKSQGPFCKHKLLPLSLGRFYELVRRFPYSRRPILP